MTFKGVLIVSITNTSEVDPPHTCQTPDLQWWITPKLESFLALDAFLTLLLSSRFRFAFSFLENY